MILDADVRFSIFNQHGRCAEVPRIESSPTFAFWIQESLCGRVAFNKLHSRIEARRQSKPFHEPPDESDPDRERRRGDDHQLDAWPADVRVRSSTSHVMTNPDETSLRRGSRPRASARRRSPRSKTGAQTFAFSIVNQGLMTNETCSHVAPSANDAQASNRILVDARVLDPRESLRKAVLLAPPPSTSATLESKLVDVRSRFSMSRQPGSESTSWIPTASIGDATITGSTPSRRRSRSIFNQAT
jgi:hypothetical protein